MVINKIVKMIDTMQNGMHALGTRNYIDFYSNGFKMRNTDADHNQSGETMLYMAFAENPFVAGGVPTTAR